MWKTGLIVFICGVLVSIALVLIPVILSYMNIKVGKEELHDSD